MRYFLYTLLFFLFLPLIGLGQTIPSDDQNYVRQINYQTPLNETQVAMIHGNNSSVDNDKKIESIIYYDGLGRSKQSVAIRAGGNREDLVTPIQYDNLGRQPKHWLPLPELGNEGKFIQNVTTPLLGYYYYAFPESLHPYNNNPYFEKRFEASPLNKILEQGAPGEDWRINPDFDSDHTLKFDYGFNSGSEVYKFEVEYSGGSNEPILLCDGSTHVVNTLYRNVTKDENWQPSDGSAGTTIEFVDNQGRTLLKRQMANNSANQTINLDTYYIYDDFGNLVFVLSPEGTTRMVNNSGLIPGYPTILADYCYEYRYDERNRLVWKKIPGKGAEKIRYDSLDRPVLTQDDNLALSNQWLFTKYDALNRVAYTGIYSPPPGLEVGEYLPETTGAISEMRNSTAVTVGGKALYYTNLAYPNTSTSMEVLTINYYDNYVDYTVSGGLSLTPPTDVLGTKTTEDISVTTTTQGLPTVSWVKTLDSGTPGMWTTTVTAYDGRGRALQVDSYNQYLQTRDWNRSKLHPILDRVLETHNMHSKTGHPTVTARNYFTYDHMGRLLSQKQKIDTSPLQLITENEYNELGQLAIKNVGGETEFDGYTLLTLSEATYDGTLTKTGTIDSWDSGAKTKGKILGNGGITFIVPQENKLLRAGLLRTTTTNDNWTTGYDYGIYFINTDSDGDGLKEMKAIVNGYEQPTIYEYDEGDTFSITRSGGTVTFKRGTVIFLTVNNQSTTTGLLGKVSFKSPGAQITELSLFGGNIDKKLQEVNYTYNLRGWLTDINDIESSSISTIGNIDLFNFRINYNSVQGSATNDPLYNGNIAQTIWKTANTDINLRSYAYTYDDLNRITRAKTHKGTTLATMTTAIDHDVDEIDYDRNGNIMHLKRWGSNENGTIHNLWDNLQYEYRGNRLNKVIDATGTSPLGNEGFFAQVYNPNAQYSYDANGNMDSDTNKGIESIRYNHLNLPTVVRFEPGNGLTNSISYIYDASGNKLEKITNVNNSTTHTQYDGGFIYSDMGLSGDLKLQFLSHPEGYVKPVASTWESVEGFDKEDDTPTSSAFKYVFQYKDHLGNIRLSYSDNDLNGAINSATEIIEESNYYPFGLQQKGYNNTVSSNGNALAQQYKFGGKEYQEEFDINTYDFGARNYDPALGRWMNIDPLAEKMRRHSPYNYAFDNPVYFIDPDGMAPMGPIWPSPFGLVKAAVKATTSFLGMRSDVSGKPERSSRAIDSSLSHDKGGGDNPTTDGPADHFYNVTPLFQAAEMAMAGREGLNGGKGKAGPQNMPKKNAASEFGEGTEAATSQVDHLAESFNSIGEAVDALKESKSNSISIDVVMNDRDTILLDEKRTSKNPYTITYTGERAQEKADSTEQKNKERAQTQKLYEKDWENAEQ